jgi:hypothetical protein
MSTIDASYASSRDLALLSNIFVPSYTYDPTNFTFQVQLDTYLQGTVNIGSSNTDYKFNINGNPYVQVTVSDWAKAPANATVDMSAYRITQLGNQVESDNTVGLPALSFYNDPSTGIYSDGPGRVAILSQSVSALMITARGISNLSNTSNSIGGVTLSGSQIITGYAVSNNVGGVTLSSGSITTVYGSRANINGVLLDRDRVFTIFDASSYIAGVTLSSGTITAGDGGSIGGVSLSGTRINATGASIVGGVSLSSGTISATNPTNNHYIGNVRIQGNNIYGVLTSGSIVALDNPYGTSNKGGGIQFWNGKLLVNTSDTTIPVGQFNVSMGDAPSMSATTATWTSNYSLFGADITSATGAALGLGYDKTNGVARIVSAQPGSGALKDMVITARNLSLAVTQLTVCGAIVNPSASVSSIGGVSLTNSLVGGVSISSGGILSPNSNVVNTIGGVILSNQKVTAQIIDTGSTNTATSLVGRVTLADGNINAPGTNSVISGVTLNNGKIVPSNVTWVAIGTNAGSGASNSVAIGTAAGNSGQTASAVAIGNGAGTQGQGSNAVAVGASSGNSNQGNFSVAIGNAAGTIRQGSSSVAIGDNTGRFDQSLATVAIGAYAGNTSQGRYSVAIGSYAGQSNQSFNSIVLNATGADLAITGARNYQNTSGFFVAPIRQSTDTANASDVDVIAWNPLTKEMFSAKNGGATLGGVAFSSQTIVAGTGTSSIGGVTLGNGAISTGYNVTSSINGVTFGPNSINTGVFNTSSYIAGVTLCYGSVITLPTTCNSIGGVTLSNSNVVAQSISAGRLQLSNLTSETANTNILSLNTGTSLVSYTSKYVQGITAGTGISISPAGPGATGVVTITATTGGTVSSVTSANANITVASTTTTPVLTLSPNLNVTTIQAGTGSSAIGGVTLNAGALTNVTSVNASTPVIVGGVKINGDTATAKMWLYPDNSTAPTQLAHSIAIGGSNAGKNQDYDAIAIGYGAGASIASSQGDGAVSIGSYAGHAGQGARAIAIGYNAASAGAYNATGTPQFANSIVIDTGAASGGGCAFGAPNTYTSVAGFFVNPIRTAPDSTASVIAYTSNNEIVNVGTVGANLGGVTLSNAQVNGVTISQTTTANVNIGTNTTGQAGNSNTAIGSGISQNTVPGTENTACGSGITQVGQCTALGANIYQSFQSNIAIGRNIRNGGANNGTYAIAIGENISNYGRYAISIGTGMSGQYSNSIVISAGATPPSSSGTNNYTNTSGLFVAPIKGYTGRSVGSGTPNKPLFYNTGTGEIWYDST